MDLNFINLYDVTQTSLIQKSNINFKFDLQILNHLILKKKKNCDLSIWTIHTIRAKKNFDSVLTFANIFGKYPILAFNHVALLIDFILFSIICVHLFFFLFPFFSSSFQIFLMSEPSYNDHNHQLSFQKQHSRFGFSTNLDFIAFIYWGEENTSGWGWLIQNLALKNKYIQMNNTLLTNY